MRCADISLDGCARCGGVWLLRSAAGAARHLAPNALAALDAPAGMAVNAPVGSTGAAARACPACRVPMEQRPDSLHPSLRIDACRACSGIWLDPGELAQFRITGTDRAAAARDTRQSVTTEDGLVGFAWCLEDLRRAAGPRVRTLTRQGRYR